jgi:predicted hotdog family 3-hydroxylacyl-ACP dehydratase
LKGQDLNYGDWEIAELVPHKPPMVLIDRILEAASDCIVVESDIDADCPFVGKGERLHAWWAVEYLAQGVAVLAGLRERAVGKPVPEGYITSCRRFDSSAATLPLGGTARITATELIQVDMSMGVFACELTVGDFQATATISVYGGKLGVDNE